MTKAQWFRVVAAFLFATASIGRDSAAADGDRPNVVIIYGDDVGFADVGVNGAAKIPTPNIDRLAAEGLNFTDGHCPASTCSASRYAMLTGRLAHRKNIRVLGPTSPMPIAVDDYTLPKLFKDAGYRTAVIGKWHLGLGAEGVETDWNGEVKPGPLEIGFDYSFLLPNTNDRVPCVYLENHRVVGLDPADPLSLEQKRDPRSTEYPDGRKNPAAMTYYPSSHGHNHSVINGIGRIGTMFGGRAALWDDETMADVFIERTGRWVDEHVEQRPNEPFFLYFASQDIHVPRTPHPRFRGKSELGYRGDAMVQLDWSVGEIMGILERHGLSDNTMVIFSSDNGPVYDDGYQDGTTIDRSTAEVDRGHDGSGPFRGGKYQIYEGGTRVPMIVRWPQKIRPGTTPALVTHTDFIASFARLLEVPLKEHVAPDSQDTMAALVGEDREGNEYIVEEAAGYALRGGDWKLVRNANAKANNGGRATGKASGGVTYELYDLKADIGEQQDLAAKHPDRVEQMSGLLEQIVRGAGVRETVNKVLND